MNGNKFFFSKLLIKHASIDHFKNNNKKNNRLQESIVLGYTKLKIFVNHIEKKKVYLSLKKVKKSYHTMRGDSLELQ